ncbi:MAG: TolC family outer membrane protein [Kangiellaceae bacterium]
MKRTKNLCLLLVASVLSTNLYADNLLDVYRLAKDNDPTTLASEAGTKAASERVNQSLASLLPQINGSASYTVSSNESSSVSNSLIVPLDSNLPTTPNEQASGSESDTTGTNYSISLTQEIYNHSSWLSLKQSEKQALQSKINHEGTKQDLIVRVAEAYFNVLAAKDSVAFSKAETKAVSQELAQTKQRFEVGLIAITDVLEAQSRHDRALANQISAQNTLDNTHELLQLITGQYHYDLLSLKSDISLSNPQPENIKQWIKEAEDNNINVKASKVGLDIAKRGISLSRSNHYPSLNLSASYSDSDSDTDVPNQPLFTDDRVQFANATDITSNSQSTGSSISINFNLPIYSGGRTNSRVKESQSLYVQAAHNLESNRRLAVSQTRSSYLGVIANVSSVNALKQAVISAEKSLEATQAGFEVGTRTIVDVLQQTQLLFDSRRQYARARYDYVLNTLRLKQATGLLTEDDLAKVNQLLR